MSTHLTLDPPLSPGEQALVDRITRDDVAICVHATGARTPVLVLLALVLRGLGNSRSIVQIAAPRLLMPAWARAADLVNAAVSFHPLADDVQPPWLLGDRPPSAMVLDMRGDWGFGRQPAAVIAAIQQTYPRVPIVVLIDSAHSAEQTAGSR